VKCVIIESPFAAPTEEIRRLHAKYLDAAIRDSLWRGEAPFASHRFYTMFLDDDNPAERKQGMEAGFAWLKRADLQAAYTDFGISLGMQEGFLRSTVPVERRTISGWRGIGAYVHGFVDGLAGRVHDQAHVHYAEGLEDGTRQRLLGGNRFDPPLFD